MKSYNTNLVDVIIPTYNSAAFLTDAVKSVLNQGDIVQTIYIIDDGSTDTTRVTVSEFAAVSNKIKYHYQPNQGLSSARNTGIKLSTAKYVAFLDADDVWLQDKLKLQIAKFTTPKYQNLGLVYGEYLDVDNDGVEIKNYGGFRLHKNIRGDVSKPLLECNYATGSGSAVLVKRECFDKVGNFDETMTACEDWDMWMRIAQKYTFDYIDSPLVKLRRHGSSMQSNQLLMVENRIKLVKKMNSTNLKVDPKLKKELRRDVLSLIIAYPFKKKSYVLLNDLKLINANYWPNMFDFIQDFIWGIYISLPYISRLTNNKIVRGMIIQPINKLINKVR